VLVDNSASMGRMAGQTRQALVLLCESLRRLEARFALVRFGRRHGQQVLKPLGADWGAELGQFALEALTFTEGSYPVGGHRGSGSTAQGQGASRTRGRGRVMGCLAVKCD
jgi:hypothetical protein